MQTFKIKNYEREHGVGTFVPYRHLTDTEANILKANLRKTLNLPDDLSPIEMVQVIQDKSILINGLNAENVEFDLQKLLVRLGLDLSENVYLNWYRYDDVDEIKTIDVLSNFSEIWYPSADDLDLIDSQMQWILLIHHSGTVRLLKIKSKGISPNNDT